MNRSELTVMLTHNDFTVKMHQIFLNHVNIHKLNFGDLKNKAYLKKK